MNYHQMQLILCHTSLLSNIKYSINKRYLELQHWSCRYQFSFTFKILYRFLIIWYCTVKEAIKELHP